MTAKYFPVKYNSLSCGQATRNTDAWKLARPFVGHPDFEIYFDSEKMEWIVYEAGRPQ